MSKEIPLTRGKIAIVDDADYEWLGAYKWCYTSTGYAASRIDGKLITMHRFLMGQPPRMWVDHINLNKLDNQRENLRIVTHKQSQQISNTLVSTPT